MGFTGLFECFRQKGHIRLIVSYIITHTVLDSNRRFEKLGLLDPNEI